MEGSKSEEDMSDSEFLENVERELALSVEENIITSGNESYQKKAEKRKERDEDSIKSDEEGFITVVRRKPKRLVRSNSLDTQTSVRVDEEKVNDEIVIMENHQVCITALESLPKQIAMAKLLRSQNITGIDQIKYKNINKAIITFFKKQDALSLLECKKFEELGFRCQLTYELNMIHGVVRGIDLDLSEEELVNIIECDVKILSLKRMNRISTNGSWTPSEAIKICFQGGVLPKYIYAYDCRFKVDAYHFPVSQCTGCWQFGHVKKFCSKKKSLCPKCGSSEHDNCDINIYKCLNCKGDHFVLDKTCPLFIKEKEIRVIMSKEQVTYRKALQLYAERRVNRKSSSREDILTTDSYNIRTKGIRGTYSSVAKENTSHQQRSPGGPSEVTIQEEEEEDPKETSEQNTGRFSRKSGQNVLSKSGKVSKRMEKVDSSKEVNMEVQHQSLHDEENRKGKRDEHIKDRFEFKQFWFKIKRIIISEDRLEDKVLAICRIIWEELKQYVVSKLLNFSDLVNG